MSTLKLLLIGNSGVGKTTVLERFVDGTYNSKTISTIGIDFKFKDIEVDGKIYKLEIWDTAGQERFRCITKSSCRNVVGIIYMFDVTDRTSFNNISNWIRLMNDGYEPLRAVSILVGNKIDLDLDAVILPREGRILAARYEMAYYEISAASNHNIGLIFEELTRLIIDHNLVLPRSRTHIPITYDIADAEPKSTKCCT
jgi:Ras-related protein Rab-1A